MKTLSKIELEPIESEPEKNPLKIIWMCRRDLLSNVTWGLWIAIVIVIVIINVIMPQAIDVSNINTFAQIAVGSIAVVLSILTAGAYRNEDLLAFYRSDITHSLYYSYIADFILTALLWGVSCICLFVKDIIIVETIALSKVKVFAIIYAAVLILTTLALLDLFIKSINRISNIVAIKDADQANNKSAK